VALAPNDLAQESAQERKLAKSLFYIILSFLAQVEQVKKVKEVVKDGIVLNATEGGYIVYSSAPL